MCLFGAVFGEVVAIVLRVGPYVVSVVELDVGQNRVSLTQLLPCFGKIQTDGVTVVVHEEQSLGVSLVFGEESGEALHEALADGGIYVLGGCAFEEGCKFGKVQVHGADYGYGGQSLAVRGYVQSQEHHGLGHEGQVF